LESSKTISTHIPIKNISIEVRSVTMTDQTDEDQPCPLLRLPPELRNRIFEPLLIRPYSIVISAHTQRNSPSDKMHKSLAPPAITRTCRKLREETLPVHYGANTFEIRGFSERLYHMRGTAERVNALRFKNALLRGQQWLDMIGPTGRMLIEGLLLCSANAYFDIALLNALKENTEWDMGASELVKWVRRGSKCDNKHCEINARLDGNMRHLLLPVTDM
jgi:hypothetical protein